MTIEENWERLYDYWSKKYPKLSKNKCIGASENELKQAEKELGVNFPKAFSDSFKICDERYLFGQNGEIGWFGQDDHFSIKHTYFDYFNIVQVNKEMRKYDTYWKKEEIAFYTYETWYYFAIDVNTGKIYAYKAEEVEGKLFANSYEEWFEIAVDEVLEYGELKLESIEKFFGIL